MAEKVTVATALLKTSWAQVIAPSGVTLRARAGVGGDSRAGARAVVEGAALLGLERQRRVAEPCQRGMTTMRSSTTLLSNNRKVQRARHQRRVEVAADRRQRRRRAASAP